MKKRILSIMLAFVLIVGLLPLQTFAKRTQKPLEGKYISVIGDSISTYQGWSDSTPITAEDCTYRYGEAYYGEQGSDCHNTDLLVTDTWWHQAAVELGATPLMINSGNSSGLLRASYPDNADWQQYLQDMLAYKTRPYYLGKDGKTPDVIALYIGSADVAKSPVSEFGSVDDIDFDALIRKNADGTFTYAEPVTVAEAYSIMLHKIQTTYPAAEIYCFTVVPNAGGTLETCNKRLGSVLPFNEMIKGVAAYHGAAVVDLFEEFRLDPDGDGVASEEDWEAFRSCYHNDPHPNAAGFDVITRCFVNAVTQNSRYVVQVETTPGRYEPVSVQRTVETIDGVVVEKQTAEDFLTGDGWRVDYTSVLDENFIENYIVRSRSRFCMAEGGSSGKTVTVDAAGLEVSIPLTQTDDPDTAEEENRSAAVGDSTVTPGITGDQRTSDRDGTYDYTQILLESHPQMMIRTTAVSVSETAGGTTYTEMTGVNNDTDASQTNDMITGVKTVTAPATPEIAEGYDLVFLGADKYSNFFSAFLYNSPAEDGIDSVYSDSHVNLHTGGAAEKVFKDRNLLVPKLYLKHTTVDNGTRYPALWSTVQQFKLTDRYGTLITGYCVDNQTNTVNGHSYRIENLEDAAHYSPEEAKMIRAIVNSGYWGAKEGYGSLQAVRDMMTASGKFTAEEVAMLTDGMAMTATQLAIWSFSNQADDMTIVNCYYSDKISFYKSDKQYDADGEKAELIFKLVRYLTELNPAETGTERSTVINEKNYLQSASVKIVGKAAAEPNNLDADPANDVYLADISFKLAAEVQTEQDDLVMTLYNADHEQIAVGRIAGTLQEGEVLLESDGNDGYTFAGIPLAEGEETTIRFVLRGTQNLGNTPYLLISERKTVDGEENVPSQPLVCVAEGHRPVGVEMTLTFCMDVSDEVYSVERHWRKEHSQFPIVPPAEPPVAPAAGSAVLTKVDACDSSKTLPNVVFALYHESGRLVGTFTTDEDGRIAVQNLPAGDYSWIELRPAEGYRLDPTAHDITVSPGGTTQITVSNTRSAVPDVFGDDHYAYIIGYDDGLVHPERNISRAEVATVFFRLLDEATRERYLTEKNSFTDVQKGMWFNTAVSTMEAMGIVNGYEDGTFRPNDSITRAEFAAIAARFDENGNPYGRPFADIFDHWAEAEICTAYNNGWILGYEDGSFKPDQYIVRSEAMTLINRVLQRIPEDCEDLLEGMVIWPDNMDTEKWYYLAVQEATNSHDYGRKMSGYEFWTVLREVRDWTVYEK